MHPSLEALVPGTLTILAYGALLSERSARVTFPMLSNFRLARVSGYRRVFAHPHFFLLSQNIVDRSTTKRIASLSAEPLPLASASPSSGFVVAAFDVDMTPELQADFDKREPEYHFDTAVFTELGASSPSGTGVICVRPPDGDAGMRPGLVMPQGLDTVWGWGEESGLLPADIYLRHVVLASQRAGEKAYDSFLDETLLCDRTTPLRKYLEEHPEIMDVKPPPGLEERFNG
mmetsp:Transcript_3372/g.6751  ORF Transcript_3372/g.6751 Transcript_3372/m.6751 type:complete len:231 (+) Transcript_3372:52-744(+)